MLGPARHELGLENSVARYIPAAAVHLRRRSLFRVRRLPSRFLWRRLGFSSATTTRGTPPPTANPHPQAAKPAVAPSLLLLLLGSSAERLLGSSAEQLLGPSATRNTASRRRSFPEFPRPPLPRQRSRDRRMPGSQEAKREAATAPGSQDARRYGDQPPRKRSAKPRVQPAHSPLHRSNKVCSHPVRQIIVNFLARSHLWL